nr:acetyl-CoA carboxylase biotin carboxylase subunit [Gemmatimonadaceae bacterium]
FYDPMLAKLIVHAPTREAAIVRMERALGELVISGVESSRAFLARVLAHPDYRSGNVSIQWLEAMMPQLRAPAPDPEVRTMAAIVGALLAHGATPARAIPTDAPSTGRSRWTDAARRDGVQ